MSKSNKPVTAPAPAAAPVAENTTQVAVTNFTEAVASDAETAADSQAPGTVNEGVSDATAPQAEAPVAPAPAPVAPVVQNTTPVTNNTEEQGDDQAELDRILKDVPEGHRYNALRVLQYVREMAPGHQQSNVSINTSQRALFKAIVNTINLEEQYFRQVFTAIIALFNRHANGVFHDVNVNRGVLEGTVNFSADELAAFTRLVTLIKVLGPVKTRAQARQRIDLIGALKFGLTEPGRDRVKEFFGA